MSEVLDGIYTLVISPIYSTYENALLPPYETITWLLIDSSTRYLLDYKYGHLFIRSILSPSISWILARLFDHRETMYKLADIPESAKTILRGTASFFNVPVITYPINQLVSQVATIFCGEMYGKESRDDAEMFFFMCTRVSGKLVGLELGSGNLRDSNNVYFPLSLGYGVLLQDAERNKLYFQRSKRFLPQIGFDVVASASKTGYCDDEDAEAGNGEGSSQSAASAQGEDPQVGYKIEMSNVTEDDKALVDEPKVADNKGKILPAKVKGGLNISKVRLEIALSCCLFSCLTYRSLDQLSACLEEKMLPGVKIFTVDTGQSGTSLLAFVDNDNEYAVLSYRGTQFEVVRQLLTSIDFSLETFQNGKVREVYMREVKKSYDVHKFEQPFDGQIITPLDMIMRLNKRGFKIYLTGHSLGGGLATLLAAKLSLLKVEFEALITFGATPVGDEAFVKWFNKAVKCSWRFVFGHEFAPLVPPLPFNLPVECKDFDFYEGKLMHVGSLIHFKRPEKHSPRTSAEIEQMLSEFAGETGLIKVLADHNPLLTMRALKQYRFHHAQQSLVLPVS